jgi:hypothetical protein
VPATIKIVKCPADFVALIVEIDNVTPLGRHAAPIHARYTIH